MTINYVPLQVHNCKDKTAEYSAANPERRIKNEQKIIIAGGGHGGIAHDAIPAKKRL